MRPIHSTIKLLLLVVAIFGCAAVVLAIVGVTTKNWLEAQGSTNILNATIYTQVLPNLTATISQVPGLPSALAFAINAGVTRAFDAVIANIGKNLEPTTYSLFDKTGNTTDLTDLSSCQGLIIAGLICLFIGTILACVIGMFGLGKILSMIPLLFLIIGPILITIGYLLYAKAIVEDFGHELGVTVHLGYSLMVIVVSSIIGYITAVLYGLTIFYRHHQQLRRNNIHDSGQVLVSSSRNMKQTTSQSDETPF